MSLAVGWMLGLHAAGAEFVSGDGGAGRFALVDKMAAADVFVEEDDWKVARIAASDFTLDVERVTGIKPRLKQETSGLSGRSVLIGTIGRSAVIDRLVASGLLDVTGIKGQWESFVIATVRNPLPGVEHGLVIAGSDRRGTAYGVYELSKRIGVSPWYWWADVTPVRMEELHVSTDRLSVGPPAVKYRGIFINDEMWGIRPWAQGNHAPEEGKGIGPKTHARIFELLLRLRANYLWPAMHLHTNPFNSYPENKQVADDHAIIMGSSHIEPMLRNNMIGAEWDREGGGDWNYQTNGAEIRRYWERRIIENGKFENIYTIGIRGKDDEPMYGNLSQSEQISLLERVFRDQRGLLSRHVNPDPSRVPQVFIPYTEVLGLYDAGLKVPDDVIICWPDDNFGYIRRLPNEQERKRPGGSGVYYHIQWINGATSAYPWLNTMPLTLMAAEMTKAWEYGADRLWVLNVGDIKPGELGMDFFLDMACNPGRRKPEAVRDYLIEWATRDLDAKHAADIADIMMEYFQLGFTRRPEHLVQFKKGQALQYSWFSHDLHNDEAGRRLERYATIARRARAIYESLPKERADAFFQLVLYPVECASLMNEKIIRADLSMRHAADGRATAREHAFGARAAAERIIGLTQHYNEGLLTAGGKWRHMMTWSPGPWGNQRHQFEMPPLSDYDGVGPPNLQVAPEGGNNDVLADLNVFTQGRRFVDLSNTGKGTIRWKATASKPWLELDIPQGEFTTGQRIWVSVDWQAVSSDANTSESIVFESNGGSARITVPLFKPDHPSRDEITGHVESHGVVSMEAEHFARRIDRDGASWRVIPGLGRSGDAVMVFPTLVPGRADAAGITNHNPAMEYDMYLFRSGDFELHVDCLPTHSVAPGRGARVAVSMDHGEPVILSQQADDIPTGTLANLRRWTTRMRIDTPGRHTLTVWMVDPGVIVDRIALHTQKPGYSYLGPPESYRSHSGNKE